jgi:hypothetical protein
VNSYLYILSHYNRTNASFFLSILLLITRIISIYKKRATNNHASNPPYPLISLTLQYALELHHVSRCSLLLSCVYLQLLLLVLSLRNVNASETAVEKLYPFQLGFPLQLYRLVLQQLIDLSLNQSRRNPLYLDYLFGKNV